MNKGITEESIKNNLPTKHHILKIFQTIDPSITSIYNKSFLSSHLNDIILTEKFGYYITIEILFQLLRTTEEERYFSTTNESDKHKFDLYLLEISHSGDIPSFPTLSSVINDTNTTINNDNDRKLNDINVTLMELKLLIIKQCNFIQKFNRYFKTYKNQIINPSEKHTETVNELEINKKLLYIIYSLYLNKEIFSFVLMEETSLLLQNLISILIPDIYTQNISSTDDRKRSLIIIGSIYSNLLMDTKDITDMGGIGKLPNFRAVIIIMIYALDNAHHEILEYRVLLALTNITSFGEKEQYNKIRRYLFEKNDLVYSLENKLCSDNGKIVCAALQCLNNSVICLNLLDYLNVNDKTKRMNKMNVIISIIMKYIKIEDHEIVFEAVKFIYILLFIIKGNKKGIYKIVLDHMLKEGLVINLNVLHQCYTEKDNTKNIKNNKNLELVEDCLKILKDLGYCLNNRIINQ